MKRKKIFVLLAILLSAFFALPASASVTEIELINEDHFLANQESHFKILITDIKGAPVTDVLPLITLKPEHTGTGDHSGMNMPGMPASAPDNTIEVRPVLEGSYFVASAVFPMDGKWDIIVEAGGIARTFQVSVEHGGKEAGNAAHAGTSHSMEGIVDWNVIALFLGVLAVIGYFAPGQEKMKKINFLDYAPLKTLLKSRWYPLVFVLPTMIIYGIILYQLFSGRDETSYNFGSVMVWILLWPVLPILFLLFGRLWCSVCPLSRISDTGQKAVGLHKKVPKFLQKYGVWVIIIAFLLITWSDSIIGLVESPRNTGYLLLFVFIGVVFMGVVFERRAWCRYVCFLGGLSSNYSMSSALELRADSEVCKKCKTPSCYKGDGKIDGCSMFEYPRTMDSNRSCNFCANCIKTCQHDAIRITPRPPTSELWFIKKPRFEESFLATALIGIVVSQTVVMLEVWEPFMKWFEKVTGITNFTVAWTLIFASAMLIPILLMLVSSFVSSRISAGYTGSRGSAGMPVPAGRSKSKLISDPTAELNITPGISMGEAMRSNFTRFGYSLIPLGLGIHLAHNAKHFLGEGLSVVSTSASLAGMAYTGSLSILNMPTIQVIQYILTALGIIGSIYTAYRISRNNPNSKESVLPYVVLMLLFGAIALWMYSVPMAARAH